MIVKANEKDNIQTMIKNLLILFSCNASIIFFMRNAQNTVCSAKCTFLIRNNITIFLFSQSGFSILLKFKVSLDIFIEYYT